MSEISDSELSNNTETKRIKINAISDSEISNNRERKTIRMPDETDSEMLKYVNRRKSQIEDVQVTVPISTKKKRGRRRRDETIPESIFIPPAVKVEEH